VPMPPRQALSSAAAASWMTTAAMPASAASREQRPVGGVPGRVVRSESSMTQHPMAQPTIAEGVGEAEAFVRRLIRDPRVLMRPWARIHQVFPAGCQRVPDEWDLSCPPMPGVLKVSAWGNGRDSIYVLFNPPMTCERLHALVRQRFGPPTYTEPDDPCGGYWELDRWRVPGSLVVSRRLHKNGEVRLQMGVEQGP
jgi:hypothetical protein